MLHLEKLPIEFFLIQAGIAEGPLKTFIHTHTEGATANEIMPPWQRCLQGPMPSRMTQWTQQTITFSVEKTFETIFPFKVN